VGVGRGVGVSEACTDKQLSRQCECKGDLRMKKISPNAARNGKREKKKKMGVK